MRYYGYQIYRFCVPVGLDVFPTGSVRIITACLCSRHGGQTMFIQRRL